MRQSSFFHRPRIAQKIIPLQIIVCIVAMSLIGGCASNKTKPLSVKGTLTATSVLNPDITGKYRPVNIKVYYLKSDSAFSQASFTDLYQYTDKALGDSIVHIKSYLLLPGQSIKLTDEAPQGVKFVGVVAAFRHIEGAQWKDIKPVPEKCFFCFGPGLWKPINIEAERLSVRLDLGAKKPKAPPEPKLVKPKVVQPELMTFSSP